MDLSAKSGSPGGGEEALKHWCMTHQIKAREPNLIGYEDEDD